MEAKNRLATAESANAKILATDIALGLAVINGQFSLKDFEKELPNIQTDNSNTNSQQNTNTSPIQPIDGQMNGAG